MSDFSLNRIRILKTGLAKVERYMDMSQPSNRVYFEELAEPGTQLKLKRAYDVPEDPFHIAVYAPDDRYLGRVTVGKNETVARLMDAGQKVIAVVNESLPIHDSDSNQGLSEAVIQGDDGWNETTRIRTKYEDCNLPYCIYLVDD